MTPWQHAADLRCGSPHRCVLPCDPGCSVLRDAARGRRPPTAGSATSGRGPAAPPTAAPVRALPGALLPGLVNTHAHTPMIALRGLGGDLPLLRWLHEVMWPAEGRMTGAGRARRA